VPITPKQYEQLRRPLNTVRVAKREQSGKTLSYLEAWDVRAHLIRVFGYGGFDVDVLAYEYVGQRDYQSSNGKDMVEVIYSARVNLRVRDEHGDHLCSYTEGAVGSASGPMTMLGEHHDNALKTAASDALKRCAMNLGTQFGLSLYDNGSTRDVVKRTLVVPDGWEEPTPDEQAVAALQHTLGAEQVSEEPRVAP
jgi:recombination DNA repair RAD52 pathway protein